MYQYGLWSLAIPAVMFCACQPAGDADDGWLNSTQAASLFTVGTLKQGDSPRREALPVATSREESQLLLARSPEVARFLQSEGQGWDVTFDRRSGLPMLLQGPGISLDTWGGLDGSSLEGVSDFSAKNRRLTRSAHLAVRRLLAQYALAGGTGNEGEFTLDPNWSGLMENTSNSVLVTLRPQSGGVVHHQARVTFIIKDNQLTQIHLDRLTPFAPSETTPGLDEQSAFAAMRQAVEATQETTLLSSALKFVALATTRQPPGIYTGPIGKGYEVRLAYIFRFTLPSDLKTYEAYVDARNGQVLDLFDSNRYARVTGGVFPRTSASAKEVEVPFENATVVQNGVEGRTDLGGNFTYNGGTASTSLGGSYIFIADGCGPFTTKTSSSPGHLNLGTSTGSDCTLSSTGSSRAARNAFYHLNNVRQLSKRWLQGFSNDTTNWLEAMLPTRVNLNQTCNAYWNGIAVHFFRSGVNGNFTCANTGEISDIMQHEYGHGLDTNTKSGSVGDLAKGEAVSDGLALLLTHDKCLGPGFLLSGSGETAACSTSARDLTYEVTRQNIEQKCPRTGCQGALGYECHCESHVLSRAYYSAASAFAQRYGDDEGWYQWERIYLLAFATTTAYLPDTAGNAYSALLFADDDNANVNDGTPNADLIFEAFNAAGIAGKRVARNSAKCPNRPAALSLTASASTGKVTLSWSALPGATSYELLRRHTQSGVAGFLPLKADLTATTHTDVEVAEGFTYQYVVVGRTPSCVSPVSARATVTVLAEGGDITAPTAGVTAPMGGATLFGLVDFTAHATDNVGVARVEFWVDETMIASRTATPYSVTWNTQEFGNGSHTLQVRAVDAAGNIGTSASVTVSVKNSSTYELVNGVPLTGVAGAQDSSVMYVMQVPAGAGGLTFRTSGGSGDADLYVKFGSAPTVSSYDCRPFRSNNDETCEIAAPRGGTYYVMLRGYRAYSGVTLLGSY